jgi:erythromycin esterase-like protein
LTGAALVERHSVPLSFENGRLSGPGSDLLLNEARNAQFVILGEIVSHVDREQPNLMAALFSQLQAQHGFNYIAVEQDPFGMEMVSKEPVRGNLDLIVDRARRFPYAMTFINDEELRLFSHVGRTSRGRWAPIWGFDQVFGAALPLEELIPLAPNAAAAAEARALLSDAQRHEQLVPDQGGWQGTRNFDTGHFVSQQSSQNVDRFRRLRQLYAPLPGGRADHLLRQLELSSEIFSFYLRSRELSSEGAPLGYSNASVREQLMKDLFMENYRHALAADGTLPRVLIKAGNNHLMRGRNMTNVYTLGAMLHEFAITNRMNALSILMLPIRGGAAAFDHLTPEIRLLLPSRNIASPTLVDLRKLRPHFHSGETLGLDGNTLRTLRDLVYGTDFALFLPSAMGAFTFTNLPAQKAKPAKRSRR